MINPSKKVEPEILESHHTVASYELDSFGHVNNAVFLNLLEKARCDFMLLKDLHFNNFHEWHLYPVVIRANLEFKRPALAGDRLHIKGWISQHTKASFTLQYEIVNQNNGYLILTGETTHVFVDDEGRPRRVPPLFYERFIGNRAAQK